MDAAESLLRVLLPFVREAVPVVVLRVDSTINPSGEELLHVEGGVALVDARLSQLGRLVALLE